MKSRLTPYMAPVLVLLLTIGWQVLAEVHTVQINRSLDLTREGVFQSVHIPTNWVDVTTNISSIAVSNFLGGAAGDLTNTVLTSGLIVPSTNTAGSAHHDYGFALIHFANPQIISRVRWSWADIRAGRFDVQGWTGTNTPTIGITTNQGYWQTVGVYTPTNYACASNGSFYQTNNVWGVYSNYNQTAYSWYQVRAEGYDTGALAAGCTNVLELSEMRFDATAGYKRILTAGQIGQDKIRTVTSYDDAIPLYVDLNTGELIDRATILAVSQKQGLYVLNEFSPAGSSTTWQIPIGTNTFSDLYVYWMARGTEPVTNNVLKLFINDRFESNYCDTFSDIENSFGWTIGYLPCATDMVWQAAGNFVLHNYTRSLTNAIYAVEGTSIKSGAAGCNKSGTFGGALANTNPIDTTISKLSFRAATGDVANIHVLIIGVNPTR